MALSGNPHALGTANRPLVIAFALLLTSVLLAGPETETVGKGAPSSAQRIPVRLGSVDAVQGSLSLVKSLGSVPGRLPVGLAWSFNSQDPVQFRVGGTFRAAVWPLTASSYPGMAKPPATTVLANGVSYTFLSAYTPGTPIPSDGTFQNLMLARGVDDGSSEVEAMENPTFLVLLKQPSSDGTKWYLETVWTGLAQDRKGNWVTQSVAPRRVILDGAMAIWTADGKNTTFSNLWGDCVTAKESYDGAGSLVSIVIANTKDPGATVTLNVSSPTKTSFGDGRYPVLQATGTPVAWSTIAVDPKVIPLGSRVKISGFPDKVFTATDTGGAIKGKHIDVFMGPMNIKDAYKQPTLSNTTIWILP